MVYANPVRVLILTQRHDRSMGIVCGQCNKPVLVYLQRIVKNGILPHFENS